MLIPAVIDEKWVYKIGITKSEFIKIKSYAMSVNTSFTGKVSRYSPPEFRAFLHRKGTCGRDSYIRR